MYDWQCKLCDPKLFISYVCGSHILIIAYSDVLSACYTQSLENSCWQLSTSTIYPDLNGNINKQIGLPTPGEPQIAQTIILNGI